MKQNAVAIGEVKKYGLVMKLIVFLLSGTMAIVTFVLGFVLFPFTTPIWIFTLWCLLCIGTCVGYRARGRCPFCNAHLEVTTRKGGVVCKECKGQMRVEKKKLYPLKG